MLKGIKNFFGGTDNPETSKENNAGSQKQPLKFIKMSI